MSTPPRVLPLRRTVPVAEVQGTLALDLQPRREPPSPLATNADAPPAGDTARKAGRDTGAHPGGDADVVPIDRTQRRQLHSWVGRFGQAAVEIVGGDRPVTQLIRWTTSEVYAELERRAGVVGRAGHHQPGQGVVQPVRPRVLSVHSYFVTPQIVETSIHVRFGARSRALAARFEARRDRWICTALQFA